MKLYLTNSGQDLLYKAQGGKTLKFSRFGLGDGDLNGQAIQPLISLINQKMSLDLKRLEIKDDKVILGAYLDNKELTEGFYLKEIGIFAIDPDTNEELLYMYGNSGETSDYIDSNIGRIIEENLTVEIYVSNASNVTATIDESLVFALAKDTYTKSQIDDKFSRLSSAYVFKGSVATENDLPTEGMQVGDVYDIKETNMNVAWNGTEWDDLGGVFEFTGDYNELLNQPIKNAGKIALVDGQNTSLTSGVYFVSSLTLNGETIIEFTRSFVTVYTLDSGVTCISIIASSNMTNNGYNHYRLEYGYIPNKWSDLRKSVPTSTSQLINDSNFKSITASTEDLEAGVSELPDGHIHLTYE